MWFQRSLAHVRNVDDLIFLLSPLFTCNQSAFVLWIKFPLLIMNEVASLTPWIHCQINFAPPATEGGLHNAFGRPIKRSSHLDTSYKKHWIVLTQKSFTFFQKCVFLMCEVLIQCVQSFPIKMTYWAVVYQALKDSIKLQSISTNSSNFQGENHSFFQEYCRPMQTRIHECEVLSMALAQLNWIGSTVTLHAYSVWN